MQLQQYYRKEVDQLVHRESQGIKKANFLALYIKARKQEYTLNNIQQEFLTANIVPLNPCIILFKLTSTDVKLPTAYILPFQISLSTSQTKILLHKDAEVQQDLLSNIIDCLGKFGISCEKDQ